MSITTQIKLADLPQNSDYACMFTHQHKHCIVNISISEVVPDNSVKFIVNGKSTPAMESLNICEFQEEFTFNNGHTQISFVPDKPFELLTIEFIKISIPEGVVITIGLIQSD